MMHETQSMSYRGVDDSRALQIQCYIILFFKPHVSFVHVIRRLKMYISVNSANVVYEL